MKEYLSKCFSLERQKSNSDDTTRDDIRLLDQTSPLSSHSQEREPNAFTKEGVESRLLKEKAEQKAAASRKWPRSLYAKPLDADQEWFNSVVERHEERRSSLVWRNGHDQTPTIYRTKDHEDRMEKQFGMPLGGDMQKIREVFSCTNKQFEKRLDLITSCSVCSSLVKCNFDEKLAEKTKKVQQLTQDLEHAPQHEPHRSSYQSLTAYHLERAQQELDEWKRSPQRAEEMFFTAVDQLERLEWRLDHVDLADPNKVPSKGRMEKAQFIQAMNNVNNLEKCLPFMIAQEEVMESIHTIETLFSRAPKECRESPQGVYQQLKPKMEQCLKDIDQIIYGHFLEFGRTEKDNKKIIPTMKRFWEYGRDIYVADSHLQHYGLPRPPHYELPKRPPHGEENEASSSHKEDSQTLEQV